MSLPVFQIVKAGIQKDVVSINITFSLLFLPAIVTNSVNDDSN